MSERFYLNEPLLVGPIELHGPEAHHLGTVSRLRAGDSLTLFNGDGCEYPARVVQVGKRSVSLEVLGVAQPARELPVALEVAAPLPRGDRGQFLVEKLTELGVTTFVPLSCQRSLLYPREGKRDKLERYVIEASKQCGRNVLMTVAEASDWANYCRAGKPGQASFLAHPYPVAAIAPERLRTLLPETKPAEPIRLAVGPEGGFTEDEVRAALAEGWRMVALGPRILRVETAAVTLAIRAAEWCERQI